ncbi:sugar ABC transporter permease, partial [Pseudomonas donghuensis]|nr:sugar ABC transporter permease [Pseudomonas donghuensis]
MSVSSTHAPCEELLLTRETPVQRRRVRAAWLFLTPM